MNADQKSQVFEVLRQVNLSINSIKDSSTALLPFCSDDYREDFTRQWEQVFHEKRAVEKDRIGLFFILHELLYRSNNKRFQEGFYELILATIMSVTESEQNKLKTEISRLIKLWNDHKVYDSQKIIRLTVNLGVESSTKDEMLLSQLPENLPNPPAELVIFAQNYKELQKYKEKVKDHNRKLQNLYEIVKEQASGNSSEMVSAQNVNEEIKNNLSQLKRNLELENKYRAFVLKNYKEILSFLDKEHKKNVVELKLFIQKIGKLSVIRDNLELP